MIKLVALILTLFSFRSYLLGYDHPTSYLILLQNDAEMRANGGFFGSYAVATLDQGKLNLRFQDIYVPDGQLGPGHVNAPKPIDEAFGKGGLYLRDTDWDPDFVNASKTIRWFFDKGGEIKPDVMLTVSLTTIKNILHVIGPITIPDYDMILTEENIFNLLQAKIETDFFPGSTQKKDILTNVGQVFWTKIKYLALPTKIKVANILWDELLHKNILVNTINPQLQTKLEQNQIAGKLTFPSCQNGANECLLDVFLSVETNLGANKANCCTKTRTTHTIYPNSKTIKHDIKIVYINNSSHENPKLPSFFGGNYIDYVRLYIPKSAENLIVTASPTLPTTLAGYPKPYTDNSERLDVSDYFLFKVIGLFHITRAGTTSNIKISYDLPSNAKDYELHILKQNGMHVSTQEVRFKNKIATTELENDWVFSGKIDEY
ncbi:hypothetical protein COU89_00635 [Candidatus Roizmanbacteria bacterium CG10_big_fil_rev_8_21_14_0_10_45_7]|uniref:Uncharacterized protein n=1 Tax=Candidatus Roizmanbacteria bacterium CG10_big_fil_rev_8_21_14_0_10_45_7 TaxID=1974854 RepID=A0A2M8KVJ9_9BACT|nr:MAG: hypothetical protein COU89_00635 [Candidatus Roizmanbacteria bacterium CG10_big_fil_rev_8_21_14_0_10_45_7]